MNRKSKILVMMLLIVTLTFGLIGCSSKDNTSTNNNQPTTEATVASYPKTITDSFDNVVELKEEPKRVVSVAPNLTELMYSLGVEDKLVGRSDYCDYPSEVLDIESVGSISTPDIEKIISLEPDVVIVSTHFGDEQAAKLTEAGIPVIGLYEENDATGVFDMITILGDTVNQPEKAATLVADMKTTFDEVETKVKDLEAPSVYYVVGYGEYGDYTAGGNTFVGKLITKAGGKNVAEEVTDWTYSLEKLVEADPEIIIVGVGEKEGFTTADGYKDLTAVKEGRVYEIDRNLLDRQGYRNAEGLKTLAEIFHKDAFEIK